MERATIKCGDFEIQKQKISPTYRTYFDKKYRH